MHRAPIEDSRKWGLYYTTNLLFKTYFKVCHIGLSWFLLSPELTLTKLNKIGLSKNIIRALSASQFDMPPMEAFPRSHIVTFKYYLGVIYFLDDNYLEVPPRLKPLFRFLNVS